jgi:DNA-binding IclR family transcriptional regulator
MSQSLARALTLLGSLGEQPRSLDELAEELGVHKTTVLRLLRTLQDEHFVHRDTGHRFHLGSRLFALAGAALEEREVRAVAAPHLARLNQATGQTVHLGVHEDGIVVYLDKHESRQPLRMYSRVGLPMPLHCTAIAKVLLADLPAADRRRAAGGGRPRASSTPATPTTRSATPTPSSPNWPPWPTRAGRWTTRNTRASSPASPHP